MPNAFWSALMPSLSSSAAGGAAGALRGQIEGPQIAADLALKQAQAAQAQAHATYYQQHQKASMDAMGKLQAGLASDPNFMRSDYGRFLAYTAGKFDPYTQDALGYSRNTLGDLRVQQGNVAGNVGSARAELLRQQAVESMQRGNASEALELLRLAEMEQVEGLTQPKKEALGARAYQSTTAGDLNIGRGNDLLAQTGDKQDLLRAKALRERMAASNQKQLAALNEQRAKIATAQAKPGAHPEIKNKYQYILALSDIIERQIDEQGFADPKVVYEYNHAVETTPDIRLGGPAMNEMFNLREGMPVTPPKPEVAPTTSLPFGFGKTIPGKPAESAKPLSRPNIPTTPPVGAAAPTKSPTPSRSAPAMPGAEEREQASLAARKLIKDVWNGDLDKAEQELKTNKKLTYTEKLALRTEIDAELERRQESAR